MSRTIKVLITNAKPTNWYHKHIGQSLEVFEDMITDPFDNKQVYLYAGTQGYVIECNDCLDNFELRSKKIERILL